MPRYWAPEAWRLRCALSVARGYLPYASADARLIDGVEYWVGWTGKGKPVPGPWWALTCVLLRGMWPCLADPVARRLVAPWGQGEGTAPQDAGPGAFRPLGG